MSGPRFGSLSNNRWSGVSEIELNQITASFGLLLQEPGLSIVLLLESKSLYEMVTRHPKTAMAASLVHELSKIIFIYDPLSSRIRLLRILEDLRQSWITTRGWLTSREVRRLQIRCSETYFSHITSSTSFVLKWNIYDHRCNNLVRVNALLRDQLETSQSEIRKLTAEWQRTRDDLERRESDWRREEQVSHTAFFYIFFEGTYMTFFQNSCYEDPRGSLSFHLVLITFFEKTLLETLLLFFFNLSTCLRRKSVLYPGIQLNVMDLVRFIREVSHSLAKDPEVCDCSATVDLTLANVQKLTPSQEKHLVWAFCSDARAREWKDLLAEITKKKKRKILRMSPRT